MSIVETFSQPANASAANVYTDATTASGWQEQEGNRLRSMREFVDGITRDDLTAVFADVRGDNPERPIELIDLGAGPDTGVEEFCGEQSVGYTAYDGNEAYLQDRPTPPERTILGRLEDLSALPDAGYDVTFSRAATAWSKDADATIAGQLRVSREAAVFAEYDWSSTSITSRDLDVNAAGLVARMTMIGGLEGGGFNTAFGAGLSERVARVAAAAGYTVEQVHVRHELPEGDHREIFVESARTMLAQMQAVAANPETSGARRGKVLYAAGKLLRSLEIIEKAPAGSVNFRLPALVTETAYIVERPGSDANAPVN